MFFADLQPITISTWTSVNPSDLRFYCPSARIRYEHLLQGRPIQLSESSLQALEVIASHGQNGVTQAELAKILGCDSKNAFHWIKSLIANDLIARTPVASKKSFTYLLTLTRYLDEEIVVQNNTGGQSQTLVSSKEIRQMIVDILAKAPDQTMVSRDVFIQTGLDGGLLKHFRRAATKLNEIGWLEYLFESQLVGPYCRLFKLKRKPAEGLDLNAFLANQEKLKVKVQNTQDNPGIDVPRGIDFRPDHPIIHQLILLLTRSYPEPLNTNQLSHNLNISRKYLYKLIERILPVSGKRAGVIGSEGVEKVTDFVGKEKRLRLFIKSEEWRDYYLKLFSETETEIASIASIQTASRPSTPLASSANSSNLQSPSDTRTRQLRHQAILSELAARKILEVGKELCHRLQEILGDNRFTLDVKTLKRSVEILEKSGQLKVVIATLPQGTTRTLLISPELSASDETVQNYIAKLNEFVRTGPLSASTIKMNRLKEAMLDPQYFVEGSLPFGITQNPSIYLKTLIKFGFVSGIMARAQLFHQYLLSKKTADSNSFETIPVIFDQLPLGLFIKLIGTVRMSHGLFESLKELESTPLQSLPEIYREELTVNRKRFQSRVAVLTNLLEQLKLIEGQEQFASLNFRLPLKYTYAQEVPLYNNKGQVQKIIKFTSTDAFDEFWTGMQQICLAHQSRQVSIHDAAEDNDEEMIPKPVLLARHPDSWKHRPSRERDLERAIKKLAFESFTLRKSSKRRLIEKEFPPEDSFNSLAEEFEVSIEKVQEMFETFVRLLEEREEAKLLSKQQQQQQQQQNEDSDSDSSDEFDQLRWTSSDWSKLSLAFCILQQPPFLSSNPNSASAGIKWNLATRIFDKPKSPIVVRRHGLKLFKSYEELRRILELETIVKLVMRDIKFGEVVDLSESFKMVFDSCQKQVNNLDSQFFEAFNVQNNEDFEILSSRQDHFLDTIDTWVQTRSFRHGLLLNNPGLLKSEKESNLISDSRNLSADSSDYEIVRLLRQILVSSNQENYFNYDSFNELVKRINPETLSCCINRLIDFGFAVRNRSKDRTRLFGFPLTISETVREAIECSRETLTNFPSIVDCNTVNLTMKSIGEVINSTFVGETEVKPSTAVISSIKLDAPVEIKINSNVLDTFNLSQLELVKRAIWFTPTQPQMFISSVCVGCLNYLEASIKAQPGISINILRTQCIPILVDEEFDALIGVLIQTKRIELIESKYLQ